MSLTTGESIYSLFGHISSVLSLSLHPTTDQYLISGSDDGSLKIWDYQQCHEVFSINIGYTIHSIIASSLLTSSLNMIPKELFLVLGSAVSEKRTLDNNLQKTNAGTRSFKVVQYKIDSNKTRKRLADLKYGHNCVATVVCDCEKRAGHASASVSYLVVGTASKVILWRIDESDASNSSVAHQSQSTAEEWDSPTQQLRFSCNATDSPITCLTASDQRGIVVTGHLSGEISIWHGVGEFIRSARDLVTAAKSPASVILTPPVSSVLHWHAHAVSCLSCSGHTGMLYSGGEEGVLVLWQLSTGTKSFLPRLGAPAVSVVAADHIPLLCVSTLDNTFRLISASSMKEEWILRSPQLSIGGGDVGKEPSAGRYANIAISINPATCGVATNGYPGLLQFSNLSQAIAPTKTATVTSVSDSLEIVSYTRVSRIESAKHAIGRRKGLMHRMFTPTVTIFRFQSYNPPQASINDSFKSSKTPSVHMLATLDVTRGEDSEPESSLKIWSWENDSKDGPKYKLAMQTDRPHGGCRVTSMAFYNTSKPQRLAGLATAAVDGTVRTWTLTPPQRLINDDTSGADLWASSSWRCEFSLQYRQDVAGALSFSRDDSLLAVSHGSLLTLWDPQRVMLHHQLVPQSALHNIHESAFVEPKFDSVGGGGQGEAFVIVASRYEVTVVDLLTMAPLWCIRGSIYCLAIASCDDSCVFVDGKQGWFAVSLTPQSGTYQCEEGLSQMLLFHPRSSMPIFCTTLPTAQRVISSALAENCILAVGADGQLTQIASTSDEANKPFAAVRGLAKKSNLPKVVLAKSTRSSISAEASQENTNSNTTHTLERATNVGIMFDDNSSSLPSVSDIYASLMDGMSKKQFAKTADLTLKISSAHIENSGADDGVADLDWSIDVRPAREVESGDTVLGRKESSSKRSISNSRRVPGDMFSDPIVAEMANLFEKKKQPFPIKEGGVIPSKRNRSHAIAESDQKISGDSSEFDTHTTGKRSKKMKSSS